MSLRIDYGVVFLWVIIFFFTWGGGGVLDKGK